MPREVQKVKVLPRSGFDKSHRNSLTMKCGTLTPLMCDEVIPNTKVHCRLNLAGALPPLASDAFMNVSLKVEAFFVPFRLLAGSFESWFADESVRAINGLDFSSGELTFTNQNGCLPFIQPDSGMVGNVGSLADYLGLRRVTGTATGRYLSAMPFLAYHRVWDDWYRNPKVQQSCFAKDLITQSSQITSGTDVIVGAAYAPYHFYTFQDGPLNDHNLADGTDLMSLRQRNFGQDFFTNCMPKAQYGDPMEVTVSSNKFTIAQLRSMNSLQQFAERNNIASPRLQDVVLARYGADLSSGVAQRAVLLGACDYPIYSKGIFSTAGDKTIANSRNPFYDSSNATPGARFGSAYVEGSDVIISGFTAQEPGYIFVMGSIVPLAAYDTGVNPMFLRYQKQGSLVEMANPLLENVGNEAVESRVLTGNLGDTAVFGYTDRYSSFKYRLDEIHGLLHDGQSLESFALKRDFYGSTGVTINTNFLRIPTTFLDDVCAVASSISTYGAWLDCYFDYKVSQPLSEYSVPSLQNPAEEHGVTVSLRRGAFSL